MNSDSDAAVARNLLWMSPTLVEKVSTSKVTVVGCGGAGAIFATYAAHLGFRRLTLCDNDSLDESNFNRYPIALTAHIGRPKVLVVKEYLEARFNDLELHAISEHFPNHRVCEEVQTSDFVVGCLDTVLPRIELDIYCRKYGTLLMDLGTGFAMSESGEEVLVSGGQILLSRPGGACLRCLGFDVEGTKNNYFVPSSDAPEPSSLLLNAVVGALAVECSLGIVSESVLSNRIEYDRGTMSIVKHTLDGKPNCTICGPQANDHICRAADFDKLKTELQELGVPCKTP